MSALQRNAPFREAVLSAGYIGPADYEHLAQANGGDIGVAEHLVRELHLPSDLIGKLWGDTLRTAYVNLEHTIIQPEVVALIPESVARRYGALAIYEFGGSVTVATANPLPATTWQLEQLLSRRVDLVFAFPSEIETAFQIYYRSDSVLDDLSKRISILSVVGRDGQISLDSLRETAGNEAVVALADAILLLAVRDRVSDIHIEPYEDSVRVRYRVDGRLEERYRLQRAIFPMLASRLKLMAGCNIAERRVPQDGRLFVRAGTRSIDFRFSTTPTIYGEKLVLRVLGRLQSEAVPALDSLLFSSHNYKSLLRILSRPHGLVLVTGPTGSGKSMTLYSCLQHLNKTDRNIMTVEDPVEYRLTGINQVQVHHDIDLTFASALRSFLRQDPDVILVGEIRDKETAKVACEAALTGHLVFATLHTNSALQAFTRLLDMGIDPFLVAPSVVGAIGQRLVRRLCETCREAERMTDEQARARFVFEETPDLTVFAPRGCERCRKTGYHGRLAVHEVVEITDPLRDMIGRTAPYTELVREFERTGGRSMYFDGVTKVLRGFTSFEEVDAIVGD